MSSKSKAPLVYKRTCDHRYTAVVTLPSGRRFRRSTGCRDRQAAMHFADLLQKHVINHGLNGHLFPTQ
jgi:hypothetical protein